MTTQTQTQTQTATTTWDFDPAHTLIEFSAKHMMFSTVKGRFTDFTGTIVGDVENPENAQIDVEIDALSIDSRNEQRDTHLRSEDFLHAELHPHITFHSTRIEKAGGDNYKVYGDLTVRGTTREVVLDSTINGQGTSPWGQQVLHLSAETQISRKEFGLTWNVALETGGVLVSDNVKFSIEIEAVKAS